MPYVQSCRMLKTESAPFSIGAVNLFPTAVNFFDPCRFGGRLPNSAKMWVSSLLLQKHIKAFSEKTATLQADF